MDSLKHNNITLISLLAISLVIHAFVFFAIHYFTENNLDISIIPPYQQSSNFSVSLENKTAMRDTKSKKKTNPIPLQNKIFYKNKNHKTNNSYTGTTKTELLHISVNKTQQNKALLLQQINSEISHSFNYPAFARRKGWQGKVLLEFNVSHTGIITNIEINNSSGYEILDHAAKISLSQIQSLKSAANLNLPLNTRLQVPIIYQLTEG